MSEEKKFVRLVLIFTIVCGVLGFLVGNFFDFFPGSNFIFLVLGLFLGVVIGVIVGTVSRLKKLSSEKDKYKI